MKKLIPYLYLLILALCLTGCSNSYRVDDFKGTVLYHPRPVLCSIQHELCDTIQVDWHDQNPYKPKLSSSEIEFFGEKYEVHSSSLEYDYLNDEFIIEIITKDDDNGVDRFRVSSQTNQLVGIRYSSVKSTGIISQADALNAALDYLENTLIAHFGLKIDTEKYEMVEITRYDHSGEFLWYEFCWQWIENGVVFHEFTITVNGNGQIGSYDSSTVFDTKLIKKIPSFTEEEYLEIVTPDIQQAYEKTNEVVDLDIHYYVYTPEKCELQLVRLFRNEQYAIHFVVEWTATSPDGRVDNPITDVFIPIADVE